MQQEQAKCPKCKIEVKAEKPKKYSRGKIEKKKSAAVKEIILESNAAEIDPIDTEDFDDFGFELEDAFGEGSEDFMREDKAEVLNF